MVLVQVPPWLMTERMMLSSVFTGSGVSGQRTVTPLSIPASSGISHSMAGIMVTVVLAKAVLPSSCLALVAGAEPARESVALAALVVALAVEGHLAVVKRPALAIDPAVHCVLQSLASL